MKTSINDNLTNLGQSPIFSKATLLALVDWVKKYNDKKNSIEICYMGKSSSRESSSHNSAIGNNVIEEITRFDNKYRESK